ncbi:aldolase/citrate lyase family protein [Chenggangzhangella methanolivorans]|uniref:HpcH/HpaI aldolase/citrate lyase domain-containing protein n=1 Tax=Chenggangzhangella methanolivorans TaxID=1437009 RepID=A0A9E6R9A2_9HYPH|nr:aldolase/citrate lyase family protein [Chenggangzhangella methanolivorans]QZN99183.1 hypothetical protein K6K41_20475 [Chenggangzhangella methanolivorans]
MRHSTKLIAAAIAAAALTLLSGGQAVQAQGPIDPETWVYGPRFDDTTGGLIWNPAKKQLLKGKPVIGPTVSTTNQETMNETYCSIASQSDADFTWTEMQHSGVDWGDAWRMWAYAGSDQCPGRKAVPGARVAYTDEREIQHALDGGAMVLVVPTVDTVEEAREVVQWTYFPPMGKRSNGGSQTAAARSVAPRRRQLPKHVQQQHRADRDDRDHRGREERGRDREGAGGSRRLCGLGRHRQLLRLHRGRQAVRAADLAHRQAHAGGGQAPVRSLQLEGHPVGLHLLPAMTTRA